MVVNIDTRKPQSSRLLSELNDYDPRVWVYWDPSFRTSLPVLLDILTDLKKWLREQGETQGVVLGLDNLREQCTEAFQEAAATGKPHMKLAYTPANTTDLCSVTDYDLGRLDKAIIRNLFYDDFRQRKDDWLKSGKEGGVSESQFRVILTKWVGKAWSERKPDLIKSRFQRCGMFNAMDGSENGLIKVRGVPDYSIEGQVPDQKEFPEKVLIDDWTSDEDEEITDAGSEESGDDEIDDEDDEEDDDDESDSEEP